MRRLRSEENAYRKFSGLFVAERGAVRGVRYAANFTNLLEEKRVKRTIGRVPRQGLAGWLELQEYHLQCKQGL